MIQRMAVTAEYVKEHVKLFNSIQKSIKDVISAPNGLILNQEPPLVTKTKKLIQVMQDSYNAQAMLNIPGLLTQFLLPKEEILLNVYFIKGDSELSMDIKLEIARLSTKALEDA